MPGVATHIAIANMINENLDENNIDEQKIKDILKENESYFKMGSLGPDMLFFAPDYDNDIHRLLKQITDFYEDIIEPIEEFHEKYIEPITDFIDETGDAIDEAVFCNLFEEVGDECDTLLDRIAQIRNNLLLLGANESVDIFDMIQPEIQKGEDEKKWYWFDMLHYRKTGTYAQTMWNNALTNKQKAYVFGYITHIAADITGHPYVNTAVGGPARSHNQRHHFVENMIDTWVYDKMRNTRFTAANIHKELPCGDLFDTEESIFRTLFRNADEIPEELEELFNMMHVSMKETFQDEIHPLRIESEYLKEEDFNFAYLAMVASLKSVSSSYIGKPENPTDDMLEAINDAMNDFLEHASNPPTNSASSINVCNPFSDDCNFSQDALMDFIQSVWENIAYLGELIAWVGQLLKDIWNIIACAVTAPIKVIIKSLFWIIHSSLYTISQEIKQVLVLTALIPPEKEWLTANPIGQSCVKLKDRSPDDGLFNSKYYPHKAQQSNEGFLSYPTTSPEDKSTVPGPYNYGSTPKDFILDAQINSNLYEDYAYADTPEDTRKIAENTRFETIGSSVELAKNLMIKLLNDENIPNWNLDADRGFAYKTWRVTAPSGVNPLAWNSNLSINTQYID